MATVAQTVLVDGKVEIPEETLKAKHWANGSRLSLVETPEGLLLKPEHSGSHLPSEVSWEDRIEANRVRLGLPVGYAGWRVLEGILADDLTDSLQEKHRLRDEELASERRKFES